MRVNKALLPRPRGVLNKAVLTQKAMSEAQKKKELAEIDRLLDELENEDLFSSFEADGDTAKGAGHKYIRKYRHGNKWRYVYANKGDRHTKGSQISHSRVLGKDEHLTEGSHFSLGAGKGHMVIEKVSGDKITYTIDGKGKKTTVSKTEFKKKVLEAHRPQVEAHAKAGLERREDILQRARKVDPNSKQTKRAEKELARWKTEAGDFLTGGESKKQDSETAEPVSFHNLPPIEAKSEKQQKFAEDRRDMSLRYLRQARDYPADVGADRPEKVLGYSYISQIEPDDFDRAANPGKKYFIDVVSDESRKKIESVMEEYSPLYEKDLFDLTDDEMDKRDELEFKLQKSLAQAVSKDLVPEIAQKIRNQTSARFWIDKGGKLEGLNGLMDFYNAASKADTRKGMLDKSQLPSA